MTEGLRQYVVALSVTSIAIAILAAFIYLKGRKKTVYWTFALYSLSTALWSGGEVYAISTTNKELALLWWKINHIGVIFIPVFFVHFVYSLLGIDSFKRYIIKIIYFLALIFLMLDSTKLLILEVVPKTPFNYFINPGAAYPLFFVLWLSLAIYGLFELFRAYFKSTGARRNQLKYLCWGTLVGYIGGAPNFLPTFNNFQIPILMPYGTYGVPIYVLLATYAIVKLRLIDIDLAWRYATAYLGYALVSSAVFLFAILFLKPSRTVVIFLIPLAIIIAPYSYKKLMARFQKAALGNKYSYWDELKNFWENKREVYTAGQLAEVLGKIPIVMGLSSFSFFLFNRDRGLFAPISYKGLDGVFDPEQAEVVNTIYPDDALPVYLAKEKRIIIRDELLAQTDKSSVQPVIEQMDSIGAQVIVPLFVVGKLTAILSLGHKKNHEMFHQQDMELLKQVARLAEKHLSHISFFDSSIIFSGSVAHDIRKPFQQGIIYNFLNEIAKDRLNPAQKEAFDNLKRLLGNIHNMSEDMVNTFRNLEIFLKTGFKPQKIDYTALINEESKSFEAMAERKRIAFEIDLPKTNLFLYADPMSVQRIVNELLTNAFKYTDKGCIKVKVSQQESNNHSEILTEVSDTGCGISEEDQKDIWELFKRGENGQTKEGEGIGLAMVRQLVEANGGKISLNSSKGNGSKFFFSLPAWEDKNVR